MCAIGLTPRSTTAVFQRFGLGPFREILTPTMFKEAARATDCASQRRRPLIPEVVVWLMCYVALQTTSMTQGLVQAWGLIRTAFPTLSARCVSEEAFCQARNGLSLRFWRTLWAALLRRIEVHFAGMERWKDRFRLLAIDGSDVKLPRTPALLRFFGRPGAVGGNARRPQAKLVALCSVLTGFCVRFTLTGRRFGEHDGIVHLLRAVRGDDLVLMDRGFFSYVTIHGITQRKAHFLMRLPDSAAGHAERVESLGRDQWRVVFRPSSVSRRKHPALPAILTARLIRYQFPGFRPSWLLTSLLDATSFPRQELVDLYHRRWQLETLYRQWKHALDIQNLRSHTPAGIRKEIYAHLLLSNLVRWVMADAVRTDAARADPSATIGLRPIDLSYTSALTRVHNAVLRMLRACPQQVQQIYSDLLSDVAAARIRKRPGRSFPRLYDTPQNKGHGKITVPARLTG